MNEENHPSYCEINENTNNANLNVNSDANPFETLCKVDRVTRAPPASAPLHVSCTSSQSSHAPSSSSSHPNPSAHPSSWEREKRELSLQLKIKEEKLKSYLNRNEYLEEMNKKLSSQNETKDNELVKFKKEISQLVTEKENLSNEIRKLSRTQNQHQQHPADSLLSSSSSASSSQSLWGQMTVASRELARAEETINSLNHEIIELKTSLSAMECQFERTQQQQEEQEQERGQRTQFLRELEEEKEKRIIAENQLINSQQEISDLSRRLAELEQSLVSSQGRHAEEMSALQLENQRLLQAQAMPPVTPLSSSPSLSLSPLSESESTHSETRERLVEELREKLFESERSRRKLHNKLQDLKGNVRVYVRCRPFLPSDHPHDQQLQLQGQEPEQGLRSCVNCNADGTTVTLSEHCQRGGGQVYQFDQVYGSAKTQGDVFKDVSDFIQSALDGYRVCVFSYGQTGSGKTHTMTGSVSGKEEDRGLIPRSVEHIINQINEMKATGGWSVEATYSMLEVYNESLIDLLSSSASSSGTSGGTEHSSHATDRERQLKIMFQNDRVVIPQLTAIPMVSSSVSEALTQLQDILSTANASRTTACTAMNERSSRSHVLFLMNLTATHQDGTMLQGGLRLVDLAGSERLDRCGTAADALRLRETVNINKSLSSLGEVFMAIGHKASHVPFRNSKLTMLLQDCLSGEGKTLMLVNISPTVASGHETYCSLKFASQVNQVQLGTAKKNITITTRTAAPPPAPPAAAPPPPAAGAHTTVPQQLSPVPASAPGAAARTRQPLSHQSSILLPSASASAGSSSPAPSASVPSSSMSMSTTLVPSQQSGHGIRSHLSSAPAARVGPASASAGEGSSQLKQAPVSLQSLRAKRPATAATSVATTAATAAGTAAGASVSVSGQQQGSSQAQASKRVKAAKSGTWR